MAEDYFEAMGLERRLGWTQEDLRVRYDSQCQEMHPDSGGEAGDFQRLRQAYAELQSPGRRLRHWLELGGEPLEKGGMLPELVTEHFGELGPLLQQAADLAHRHAAAQSSLVRSMAEREGMGLLPKLELARERIEARIDELEQRFTDFDARGVTTCGGEAKEVARSLLFLEKWEREVREAWGKMGCW
ncbi:MAG: hypothetical protein VCA35_11250 [Roseibacillus sp.]